MPTATNSATPALALLASSITESLSVLPATIHVTTAPISIPAIPARPTLTALISSLIYVPAMQVIMTTAIPPALSAVPIASLVSLTLNASPATHQIIAPYPLSTVPALAVITKTASTLPARLATTLALFATAAQVQIVTTALIFAHLPCHIAVPA